MRSDEKERKEREPARSTERAPRPQPGPVDLSDESVAGEEDPGAALDVTEEVPTRPEEQPGHERGCRS